MRDDDSSLRFLLTLSLTRRRSPKARQLATTPQIELAWWLAATQHQFRIVGRAYILPSPSFSSHPSPASSSASDPTLSTFSFLFPGAKLEPYEGFNWEHERVRQFRRMSPELRASFYRPVPGTTLEKWDGKMEDLPQTLPESVEQAENDEQKKQVEEGESKRWLRVRQVSLRDLADSHAPFPVTAMKNFALIVIDATEVDLCVPRPSLPILVRANCPWLAASTSARCPTSVRVGCATSPRASGRRKDSCRSSPRSLQRLLTSVQAK